MQTAVKYPEFMYDYGLKRPFNYDALHLLDLYIIVLNLVCTSRSPLHSDFHVTFQGDDAIPTESSC